MKIRSYRILKKYGLLEIISYINNSYTKDLKNKKLIIRHDFFLVREIVIWYNKR